MSYISIGHYFPNNRKGEAVQCRIQTAQLLTQQPRQHRYHFLHQIDAGRPLQGAFVKRAVLVDKVAHVGYVHTDLKLKLFNYFLRIIRNQNKLRLLRICHR